MIFWAFGAFAQHWVFFTDKCDNSTNYYQTAVCEDYIQGLSSMGVEIIGTSKWLNAAFVQTDQLDQLADLPYVASTQAAKPYKSYLESEQVELSYGNGDWQLELIGLDSLHRLGYTGSGVTIGVFDGGFNNMDSIPAFDSLWFRNQIIASRDFSKNSDLGFDQSAHGMQVMSLLGAYLEDSLIGASPDANYVLARTEVTGTERHQEEFNWISAMEWADSVGVDIIHSSLGYSEFDSLEGDYSYEDMDGESTIITIAAEIAASRGIFITNSAGNQGNDPWYYITAPCDGEHVLCIGAVDSFRQKAEFSSFGPSSDGRVKPDLMAMGVRNTILRTDGSLRTGSGTSFSGPIIAGAVACLMEAHPERSNQAIFTALIMSCDRYNSPDSAYGHGIPDLLKADSLLSSFAHIEPSSKGPNIKVYPNPVTNRLTVICQPQSTYELLNSAGKLVLKGSFNNLYNFLDMSQLAQGNYYLNIRSNQQLNSQRIVVHH